jgi:hypothetical protein
MTSDSRLERIEQWVPGKCERNDERINSLEEFSKDIRGWVKWGTKVIVGSAIAAIVTTSISVFVTTALARGK